jgi:hypothetical protein
MKNILIENKLKKTLAIVLIIAIILTPVMVTGMLPMAMSDEHELPSEEGSQVEPEMPQEDHSDDGLPAEPPDEEPDDTNDEDSTQNDDTGDCCCDTLTEQIPQDNNLLMEYNVVFVNWNWSLIEQYFLEPGNIVTPPNPERTWYYLVGWRDTHTNEFFALGEPIIVEEGRSYYFYAVFEPLPELPINIPDPIFLEEIRKIVGKPSGEILFSDVSGITSLHLSGMGISSLSGINHFTALEEIYADNNNLSNLELYGNPLLKTLDVHGNRLTWLQIHNSPMLEVLDVRNNSLSWILSLNNTPALKWLDCGGNKMTILDLSNNPLLEFLWVEDNQLKSLDLSNNSALRWLDCSGNVLENLILHPSAPYEYVSITNNYLPNPAATGRAELPWDINLPCHWEWCDAGCSGHVYYEYYPQRPIPVIIPFIQPTLTTTFTRGNINGILLATAITPQQIYLNYQWYKNDVNSNESGEAIAGAYGPTFLLPEDLAVGTHYFYCVFSFGDKFASRASRVAIVNVIDPFSSVKLSTTALRLEVNESETLNAIGEPIVAIDGIEWRSTNPNIADVIRDLSGNAVINGDGTVTVKAGSTPGTVSIIARSQTHNHVLDVCFVTVIPKPVIAITSNPPDLITGGRIIDDLSRGTITLNAENVIWSSSDTRVATIHRATGVVLYRAVGTTTITATKGTGAGRVTERVILTIRDITPKLPVSTITVYTNAPDGTQFMVLPDDNFRFDSISIIGDAKGLLLGREDYHIYSIRSESAVKGRVVLELQAVNNNEPVGSTFRLTVNVATGIPKATVRIPTLNTFWTDSTSPIIVTGKNLPKIVNIELSDRVARNFWIEKIQDDTFILVADATFSQGSVITRGDLRIYYEGFEEPYVIRNFNLPIKKTTPKLTLSPSTQIISTHSGSANTDTVTFQLANSGAIIGGVEKVDTAAARRANWIIEDYISAYDNSFTVTMREDAYYRWVNGGTYGLQLNVWLERARYPIVIRPKVRTTRSVLTAAQTTPRVTVRALAGTINLMDRGNTQRVFVPTLRNSPFAVLDNLYIAFVGTDAVRANEVLNVEMKNGNAVVTAKQSEEITGPDIRRGERFRVQLRFALTNGTTVTSPVVNIATTQSRVRHNIPRQIMFQSRTGVLHQQVIDIKPITPAGTRVASIGFKAETTANIRRNRQVNNPNGAYWYSFDKENQKLNVWIQDSSLVRPGNASLTFSVTYEGQGREASGNPRLIDLKVPINIRR